MHSSVVGEVQVDLLTIATGPKEQRLPLFDTARPWLDMLSPRLAQLLGSPLGSNNGLRVLIVVTRALHGDGSL